MPSNPLGSYSFVVCKSTGENVGEAVSAKERSLSFLLNGVHSAKLTLSTYDALAPYILPGVARLKVFRNPSSDELAVNPGQTRSLVFYGTLPEDFMQEDAAADTVTATFADPRFVLGQRYAAYQIGSGGTYSDSYAATDQGSIGWGLINSQNSRTNGDTWLRQGGITTGILRDRVYDQRKVSDLLAELSQVIDGCDFDVDPIDGYALGLGQVQGNFRAYARQGSDKPQAIFSYGPGILTNVKGMTRAYLPAVNRATVTGTMQDGAGNAGIPISSTYDASNASFGIRESIEQFPDNSIQATIDAKARGIVLEQSSPREVITIAEPTAECKARPFEHYYLGDTVRGSCRKGSIVFTNRSLRVHGIDIILNDKGYAAVKLTTGT